ncbi:sugar O-acetyltransferase [Ligilactobacillus murinus]|nr:sugar O-acetyltransferase [Ligilactobacillus murinus]
MLGKQTHRMQCGMMYNDLDPELMRARQKTMALTTAYAQSYSQSPAKREALLAKILGKIGKNVHFEPTFRCEFGKNISIGDNFFANFDCIMLDGAKITIGNNVLFGPRVGIYTADHTIDKTERQLGDCQAKPVTIGDNTVIESGNVVTHDIPSNVVAYGDRKITAADKTGYDPTKI